MFFVGVTAMVRWDGTGTGCCDGMYMGQPGFFGLPTTVGNARGVSLTTPVRGALRLAREWDIWMGIPGPGSGVPCVCSIS